MGCTNHAAVEEGLQQCWVCARPFCGDCVVEFQGRTLCGPCKAAAVARLETGGAAVAGEDEVLPPWERRAELGVVQAFLQTCKESALEPSRLFSRLDRTRTVYDCLVFAVVIAVVGAIFGAIYGVVFQGLMGAFVPQQNANPFMLWIQGGAGLLGVILSPIFAVILAFVSAGLTHVGLVVMKKQTATFHQTFRVFCYSRGPTILAVVPLVGGIGGIWALVSFIIGVKEAHRTTGLAATIAVLWWALLCGCGLVAIVAVAMFGVLGARGH